jgi:DNA-binding NarL/FixJ family response regulator
MKVLLIGKNRQELKSILYDHGMEIQEADDLEQTDTSADIIITEPEPLLKAGRKGPGIPVICYTDNDDEYIMLAAIDAGADFFVNITPGHRTLISVVNSFSGTFIEEHSL